MSYRFGLAQISWLQTTGYIHTCTRHRSLHQAVKADWGNLHLRRTSLLNIFSGWHWNDANYLFIWMQWSARQQSLTDSHDRPADTQKQLLSVGACLAHVHACTCTQHEQSRRGKVFICKLNCLRPWIQIHWTNLARFTRIHSLPRALGVTKLFAIFVTLAEQRCTWIRVHADVVYAYRDNWWTGDN